MGKSTLAPCCMPSTPSAVVVWRFPLRSNFQAIAFALSPSAMKRNPPSLLSTYPVATRDPASRMTPLLMMYLVSWDVNQKFHLMAPKPEWSSEVVQTVDPVAESRAIRVACIFPVDACSENISATKIFMQRGYMCNKNVSAMRIFLQQGNICNKDVSATRIYMLVLCRTFFPPYRAHHQR